MEWIFIITYMELFWDFTVWSFSFFFTFFFSILANLNLLANALEVNAFI